MKVSLTFYKFNRGAECVGHVPVTSIQRNLSHILYFGTEADNTKYTVCLTLAALEPAYGSKTYQ